MRILQFITTTLLRRNQTELVPYSAKYNFNFTDDSEEEEVEFSTAVKNSRDFEFYTG